MADNNKQKLELTWIGKNEQVKPESRILLYDKEKSYGDQNTENMLIHGDNLLALKALEQDYAGKIKCIYIDPPYNTREAFEEYDDNLEHSLWLELMKRRLELLKNLLDKNGVIFLQLNDDEVHYCKIIMDEVFGRKHFINMISVFTKMSAGASGGGEDRRLKKNIEYILIYAKDLNHFEPFAPIYKRTLLTKYISDMKESGKSYKYTNVLCKCENKVPYKVIKDGSGEDIEIFRVNDYEVKTINQLSKEENLSIEDVYMKYYDRVMTTTNSQSSIRTRVWEATDSENNMYLASYFPKSGKNKGKRTELILLGKQKVLVIWLKDTAEKIQGKLYKKERIGTFWDGISWINVNKEGTVTFTGGKKPEELISRIIKMSTNEGDFVLDSFLGSGSTAAVAHKLNRKYIGIELGDHCYSICQPRLKSVVDGDATGISKAEDWQGGGGFKFYELPPSLIKTDIFGNEVIDASVYSADMLAAAVAKINGYKYNPDEIFYWKQGVCGKTSYIFTTTEYITAEHLNKISDELGGAETLLICCTAFEPDLDKKYENIDLKKIPQCILGRCEYGKDNYNLNTVNTSEIKDVWEENEVNDDE